MKKKTRSRKIEVSSYNRYSSSKFLKFIKNPISQILFIILLFILLQVSGIVEILIAGIFTK